MKFGLLHAGAGPWATLDGARALAQGAEQFGFDSLWATDHAVVNAEDSEETYRAKGGSWDFSSEYPIMDPMGWLSFVAALTDRITLATGILIAPIRPAPVLAKQAATLDLLSNGRFVLGVGSGWVPEELAACGIKFEDRLAIMEECVHAMRALWQEPAASFHGQFVDFERMTLAPRPPSGRVPVVLGGRVRAAAERAGRLGDGYFPHTRDVDQLRGLIEVLRSAAEQAGRDPSSIEIIAGGAREAKDIDALRKIGVTHVVVSPRAQSIDELPENLERIRRTLITEAAD
jgi:probable F420-dependent oxidoreductase